LATGRSEFQFRRWVGITHKRTIARAQRPKLPATPVEWAGKERGEEGRARRDWFAMTIESRRYTVAIVALGAGAGRSRLPHIGITLNEHYQDDGSSSTNTIYKHG
jgi:hypothetical protein